MADEGQCFEEVTPTPPVPPPPGSRSPEQQEEIRRGIESLGLVEDDLS